VTIATIIGQVSDIIAHSNPGSTAQADAVGLVNSFLLERQVPATLLRRIRAHYMQFYRNRGGVVDIAKVMRDMPHTLQLELGAALSFLDDPNTRRRSVMCKVPFFQALGSDDLIRVGCKLQHVQMAPAKLASNDENMLVHEDTSNRNYGTFIMREGDRGEEMWIIIDGVVKIQSGFGDGCTDLGKLREGDYFGEMAVLAQESPGVPLPRFRSAYAVGVQLVLLYTLTYTSVQELCAASPHIDAAVREAEGTLRHNRPSLFPSAETVGAGLCNQPATGSLAALEDRVARLEMTVQAGFEQLQKQLRSAS
jgi:CRP-like cAMP-binding protein